MLGAFLLVVGMFLKHQSAERAARENEREADRVSREQERRDYLNSIEKLTDSLAVERREYLTAIEKLGAEFSSTVKLLTSSR